MSQARHVLHVAPEPESGEWQAWCCCGWASYTWRLEESARTAADTHAAFVNSRGGVSPSGKERGE